jgi:hypothetical protein
MGPSFEFADFRRFINLAGHYKNIPVNLAVFPALKELL